MKFVDWRFMINPNIIFDPISIKQNLHNIENYKMLNVEYSFDIYSESLCIPIICVSFNQFEHLKSCYSPKNREIMKVKKWNEYYAEISTFFKHIVKKKYVV